MRVLAVAADPGSTITRLRVAEPLAAWLANVHGELRLRPLHDVPPADLAWCEVLVVQRGMARRHLELIRAAAAAGRAVVCEIDDLLTDPAPHLQHARALLQARPWTRACLAAADVVTLSTERLATLLDQPPERCVVVPNAAFDGDPGVPPESRAVGPVSLLVAASDRVAGAEAWLALREFAAAWPGRIEVLAVGPVADDLERAGIVCRSLPLMPRDAFVRWAASQPNPLAMIPLDDSRFSAGKSAVKWFDYAVAGVPTLASGRPPYADVIEHGRTGWLVGPAREDWHRALAQAVDDGPARARVARAAREAVQARHHAGLTRDAWGRALHQAAARAAARGEAGVRALPRGPGAWWSDLSRSLRRWNRERLMRRPR